MKITTFNISVKRTDKHGHVSDVFYHANEGNGGPLIAESVSRTLDYMVANPGLFTSDLSGLIADQVKIAVLTLCDLLDSGKFVPFSTEYYLSDEYTLQVEGK